MRTTAGWKRSSVLGVYWVACAVDTVVDFAYSRDGSLQYRQGGKMLAGGNGSVATGEGVEAVVDDGVVELNEGERSGTNRESISLDGAGDGSEGVALVDCVGCSHR